MEYLPVVVPTARERRDPHEFAERTRHIMAKALGVVCTEHNFLDVKLALAAQKLKQPAGRSLVEFGKMEKLFRLDIQTAQEYLAKFSAMDRTHSGVITLDEFMGALDLPQTEYTEQVFNLFDKHGHGYINFREVCSSLPSYPIPLARSRPDDPQIYSPMTCLASPVASIFHLSLHLTETIKRYPSSFVFRVGNSYRLCTTWIEQSLMSFCEVVNNRFPCVSVCSRASISVEAHIIRSHYRTSFQGVWFEWWWYSVARWSGEQLAWDLPWALPADGRDISHSFSLPLPSSNYLSLFPYFDWLNCLNWKVLI